MPTQTWLALSRAGPGAVSRLENGVNSNAFLSSDLGMVVGFPPHSLFPPKVRLDTPHRAGGQGSAGKVSQGVIRVSRPG